MQVILADAMGLCFGVRDALAATRDVVRPEEVTVFGQLVHNELVMHQLAERGFARVAEGQRAEIPDTPTVLVTAHGISNRQRQRLLAAGKQLLDTTCPLVRRVHDSAQELQRNGYHVLVLGQRGHVEVQGIIEDLTSFDVVSQPADVRTYDELRLGIVCQSTTPPHVARELVAHIQLCNPLAEIRWIDTICDPTRRRQQAVRDLLGRVDAVVIVGGRNSNNTRQLVALCQEHQVPAFHVQSADDLDPAWFARCKTVGLTAGTSTLDETIFEVQAALLKLTPKFAA